MEKGKDIPPMTDERYQSLKEAAFKRGLNGYLIKDRTGSKKGQKAKALKKRRKKNKQSRKSRKK